jgi:ABC-type branched-subunit amino acid transport system substrate-binding protein
VKLKLALSLSLSGEYAVMGRAAEAGLRILAEDGGGRVQIGGRDYDLELDCRDDASDAARCAEIYRALCAADAPQIILGPYSSALARVAAPIAERAHRVFINHGGAGDDLYQHGHRMTVGVASCASEYLVGFVSLLATLKFWRKRIAIVAEPTPFARAVAGGIERAAAARHARRRGVRVRVKYNAPFDSQATPATLFPALKRNRVNILVSAGSYAHDVATMRAAAAQHLNLPVLACVAAGVARFGADLGAQAAGIVGPSQWEEDAPIEPKLGLAPHAFAGRMRASGTADCDYPAAQAYAGGLLALGAARAADSLDPDRMRAAFDDLRTSTLLGDFAIDPATGRQTAHKMLLVQWHGGRKVIIEPEPRDSTGTLEFPSGWRLVLAGLDMLRLNRGADDAADERDQD